MIWFSVKHHEGEKFWLYIKLADHTFRSEFPLTTKEIGEAMDHVDIEETLGAPRELKAGLNEIER